MSFSFPPSQFFLHNHLSFVIYFHREKLEEGELHDYRVVRFEVVPQSVRAEGRRDDNLSANAKLTSICRARITQLMKRRRLSCPPTQPVFVQLVLNGTL